MAISSLMTIGARALTASYAALQTTGHNIANVNTAGYSRQQTQLETAGGESTGAGFFGRGVAVGTVGRANDTFLTREAAATQSVAAADSARLDRLQQLEKVFATGEDGLGHAADQLLNAYVDVAARPSDIAARQVVLARADDAATRFRAAGEQIEALQGGVADAVKTSVDQLNGLAQNVARLNDQIVRAQAGGHLPNDLLDQRDRLVGEIGKLVQVSVVPSGDGAQNLFIGGNQRLVVGNDAVAVSAVADSLDPSRTRLAAREGGSDRLLPDALVTGGSIGGLLRFQNQDLADARNTVGQLAAALAGAVNRQQSLGLDLNQPGGSGAPIFAVGAPRVLPASTNAGSAGGVGLAVVDAGRLQASDYELAADPSAGAGAYRLTRLADGLSRTVTSGAVVDGLRIDIAAPAPQPGDRFLLQPVADAASSMRRVLDAPAGIAAASPVTASLGRANTGSATVASLAVNGSVNPALAATVSFTSAGGDYAWELRDSGSGSLVSSGSGSLGSGATIALDGWELKLNGTPRSGDTVAVGRTAFAAADNGNALATAGLRLKALVAGNSRQRRRHSHRCLRRLDRRCRRAGAERHRQRRAVGFGRCRRRVAPQRRRRRQPRRGGGAPDPVPAELPGGGQGAAGRAGGARHPAADGARMSGLRISTAGAYEATVTDLQQRQRELADTQQRISSGKRVQRGSDDPIAAARAERALAAESRGSADQRAVEASRTAMTQGESALGGATELLQQAREALVASGSGIHTDSQRSVLADQLRDLRRQLLDIANRDDGAGGRLFAGQGSAGQPFLDRAGGVAFQGARGAATADADGRLPLAIDGASVFLAAPTGNGSFETQAVVSNGSAWIDAGRVADPSALTGAGYTLQFSVAGGSTTYAVFRDGAPTAVTAAPYAAGQPIVVDGQSVTISGTPAAGDTSASRRRRRR